jgi:hypothetical protein
MIGAIAHGLLYSAIALYLLTDGGNRVCRALLSLTGVRAVIEDSSNTVRVGRIIGSLERLLIAIGIMAGSWEVLAGVVALKSVARFKELDDQLSAEYFLVGSLFSLFWSVTITGAWLAYDRNLGISLSQNLEVIFVEKSDSPANSKGVELYSSSIC